MNQVGRKADLFFELLLGQQPISKSCRRLQIPLRSPGLVEIDEPFGQIGVIFQIGIDAAGNFEDFLGAHRALLGIFGIFRIEHDCGILDRLGQVHRLQLDLGQIPFMPLKHFLQGSCVIHSLHKFH